MQVMAITKGDYARHSKLLDSMFRLRAQIFRDRLRWDVRVIGERERDEYDRLSPAYIVALTDKGRIAGSARLLPAFGPTMAVNTFPQLMETGSLHTHARMIESSRFCVDTELVSATSTGCLHEATLTMLAGIIEWSVTNGYNEIVTVTDTKFERLLRKANWPLARLGDALPVGNTMAVAGILPADQASFERLCPLNYSSRFPAKRRVAA